MSDMYLRLKRRLNERARKSIAQQQATIALGRLGLTGLSLLTLASGPCGGCPDLPPETQCEDLDVLIAWRDKALAWEVPASAEDEPCAGDAGISDAGAAGMSGGDPQEGCLVYTESGELLNTYDMQDIQDAANGWRPEAGCPSFDQLLALRMLRTTADDRTEGEFYLEWREVEGDEGTCCYYTPGGSAHCPGGRPFLIDGTARVAEVDGTCLGQGDLMGELGEAWLRDALAEHASIAAFARLSLQLMHVGAPTHLVTQSQRASLDEARHTELCLAQVEKLLGERPRLGRLDVAEALGDLSLEGLLVTNIIEGCVGETLAAARAQAQAAVTCDERLARELRRLARDEERHAGLAWEVLRWILEEGSPDLRARAIRTFAEHAPQVAQMQGGDQASQARQVELHAAGRLTPAEEATLNIEVWESTVLPLAVEMLSGSPARPERPPSRSSLRPQDAV